MHNIKLPEEPTRKEDPLATAPMETPSKGGVAETFADKCQNILQVAAQEVITTHPEDEPPSLCCLIGMDLLQDPVITPSGYVYSRQNIVNWLSNPNHKEHLDPGNRRALSLAKVISFNEIKPIISMFLKKRALYNLKKREILRQAIDIVYATGNDIQSIEGPPALFTCPISGKTIRVPLITPEGKIYDKASLIQNNYKDENNQPLKEEDCRFFDSLHKYLQIYEFYEKRHETGCFFSGTKKESQTQREDSYFSCSLQ